MEEINFIRPQEVYDRNTGESKVRYTSYDGSNKFIPVVDGEDGVPRTLVVTTHAELKAMRDAGKLTPGSLYRITDYQCTTTQENTRSAGHQFDIVLLALSENKLAEEGWAMPHDGDEYFQNSKLEAWKVWYCLDNDKSRFAWADDRQPYVQVDGEDTKYLRNNNLDFTLDEIKYFGWGANTSVPFWTKDEQPKINDSIFDDVGNTDGTISGVGGFGRGVIYRLIDEWNNDVPYDFKNIQFVRPMSDKGYDPDSGEDAWVYTFNTYSTDIEYVDSSNVGRCTCYSNYITPASINNVLTLPNNVLLISEGEDINVINSKDCTVTGDSVTLNACTNCIVGTYYGTLICCNDFRVYEDDEGIYINNKKVLTEDALNGIETALNNI